MGNLGEAIVKEEDTKEKNIYDLLRLNIMELRFRPGMMIGIKDICDMYKEGRSPVRDALIRLSREGLVTFLPQRGTMISKIKMERVENQRFMRRCIEPQVMMEFMAKLDLKWITTMEVSIQNMEEACEKQDFRLFLNLDDDFHSIFYRATKRSYVYDALQSNSGDYRRIRLLINTEQINGNDVIGYHKKMMAAIKERDSEELRRLFYHHIDVIVTQERTLLKHFPELFDISSEEPKRDPNELQIDFLIDSKLKYDM